MRNKLDFHTVDDDGVFWMTFGDFLIEFCGIHVCKNLKESKGWKNMIVLDKWEGDRTGGICMASNQKMGGSVERAPQYAVTINKPGTGFFVFRMKEV